MRGYELTERGKIILAAIVVFLLLLIPSVILMIKAGASAPSESPPGSEASVTPAPPYSESPDATTPPVSPDNTITPSESPDSTLPPSESPNSPDTPPESFDNTETPDNAPESSDAPDNSEKPAETTDNTLEPSETPDNTTVPPKSTQMAVLSGDILTFQFTPASQTTLDADTCLLLEKFLSVPDYLPNYFIMVETPLLSDYSAVTVQRALADAFAVRGISEKQIEYTKRPPAAAGGTFEVKLRFISLLGK